MAIGVIILHQRKFTAKAAKESQRRAKGPQLSDLCVILCDPCV